MNAFLFHMGNYIRSGGVVMIPILAVSFIMWMLIINRIFVMRRLFNKNMTRHEAGRLIRENRMPQESYKGANSLLVREFLARRTGQAVLDGYILDETVLRLTTAMDRYLAVIAVLSGVAPLLGLLGTVVGMMATFDVITIFGTGNARAMAGGISVALITTQTGLLVSIPGLYMSGFLHGRAKTLKHRISATGMYLRRFL